MTPEDRRQYEEGYRNQRAKYRRLDSGDMTTRTCCDTPAWQAHTGTCPNSLMRCGTERFSVNELLPELGKHLEQVKARAQQVKAEALAEPAKSKARDYERKLATRETELTGKFLDAMDAGEPVWQVAAPGLTSAGTEKRAYQDWLSARRTYILGADAALETMCSHVTMDNPPLAARPGAKTAIPAGHVRPRRRYDPVLLAFAIIVLIWGVLSLAIFL